MDTYTIPAKQSGCGSIHDIAREGAARTIRFAPGCKYAVVLASYYGGPGYTTHKTAWGAIRASIKQSEWSHAIIDSEGNKYGVGPKTWTDPDGSLDLLVCR